MKDLIIGIDPGTTGGIALLSTDLKFIKVDKFSTPKDVAQCLDSWGHLVIMAYIEGVNSRPGMGIASMFKFGMNYGIWQGLLTAFKIPFQRVYPLKWQTYMGCRTGGNKNISKARAQELFPLIKVTHAVADAILIAEYGRRQQHLASLDDI